MSNRNNPVRFTVDFAEKQIIGTKTSLNKAKYPGSEEYKELCGLMKAHPQFKIVAKAIKENKSKQTYKALTFTFIEKYISIQSDKERIMQEYKAIKISAKNLGRSVYPDTKRWFVDRFSSKDHPFDMDEATIEIETAAAQTVVAE